MLRRPTETTPLLAKAAPQSLFFDHKQLVKSAIAFNDVAAALSRAAAELADVILNNPENKHLIEPFRQITVDRFLDEMQESKSNDEKNAQPLKTPTADLCSEIIESLLPGSENIMFYLFVQFTRLLAELHRNKAFLTQDKNKNQLDLLVERLNFIAPTFFNLRKKPVTADSDSNWDIFLMNPQGVIDNFCNLGKRLATLRKELHETAAGLNDAVTKSPKTIQPISFMLIHEESGKKKVASFRK